MTTVVGVSKVAGGVTPPRLLLLLLLLLHISYYYYYYYTAAGAQRPLPLCTRPRGRHLLRLQIYHTVHVYIRCRRAPSCYNGRVARM